MFLGTVGCGQRFGSRASGLLNEQTDVMGNRQFYCHQDKHCAVILLLV